MMKATSRFLGISAISAITIAGFIAAGCSGNDKGSDPESETGEVGTTNMALTANDGDGDTYCIAGTILITGTSPGSTPSASVVTDCADTVHSVVLLPGSYSVAMQAGYTSSYFDNNANNPGHVLQSCSLNPNPTTFDVTLATTMDLPLSFTCLFTDTAPSTIVFGVGAVDLSLGTPNSFVQFQCGNNAPVVYPSGCAPGSQCLELDNADGGVVADCYVECDFVEGDTNGGPGLPECAASSVCIPVLPPAGIPVEMDLDLVPGICVATP